MLAVTIGIILCAVGVGYCYVLYPSVIRSFAERSAIASTRDVLFRPRVSVILAVHNEERVIEYCLRSLLSLEYPPSMIEILVGSDGSTDRTDEILRTYAAAHEQIRPFFFETRRGKMGVLNDLVDRSTNDILFFVDGDVELRPDALMLQVQHYADHTVGAVAGVYEIKSDKHSSLYEAERRYATLDQQIREAESAYHSTVALFGGNYTIRRSLWKRLPDGPIHDDFFVVLSVIDQGYRVLSEPRSVSSDQYVRTTREEFRRKSRSASRGFHTLSFFPQLILPRAGRPAFMLWSHKLLRWLSPFLVLIAVGLAAIGFYTSGAIWCLVLLWIALAVGALVLLGSLSTQLHLEIPIIERLSWFVTMNAAYIAGTFRFITRSDEAVWKQSSRPIHHIQEAIRQ